MKRTTIVSYDKTGNVSEKLRASGGDLARRIEAVRREQDRMRRRPLLLVELCERVGGWLPGADELRPWRVPVAGAGAAAAAISPREPPRGAVAGNSGEGAAPPSAWTSEPESIVDRRLNVGPGGAAKADDDEAHGLPP